MVIKTGERDMSGIMKKKVKVKPPLASIVILNWNGKRFLNDCFRTLLEQDYPHMEIIMPDNSSTDGSVEYVKREFPSVRIVETGGNLGFSGGVNAGIRVAKGEYIIILNNDMIFHRKDCISELVKAAGSDDRIGVVGGMWLDVQEPKRIQNVTGTNFPRVMDFLIWFGKSGTYEEDRGQYKKLIEAEGCIGLVKREVFDKVGLYDEGYFFTYEEVDLCYRAKQAGYRIVINPNAKMWHVGRGTARSYFLRTQYYAYRGRLRFAMKNFRGIKRIAFIVVNIVGLPLLGIRDAWIVLSRRLGSGASR